MPDVNRLELRAILKIERADDDDLAIICKDGEKHLISRDDATTLAEMLLRYFERETAETYSGQHNEAATETL